MSTKKYFDKKASVYNEERTKGFLGTMVKKESKKIMEFLNPQEGETILDAGCGAGFYSELIQKEGAVPFGIDISPQMVAEVRKKGFQAEVHNLDFFDLSRKFDKVLCAGNLEFCKNSSNIIKNLKNHIKDNGHLVLLYPRFSVFGIIYYIFHLFHKVKIRTFSKKTIRKLLEGNGLKILAWKKATLLTSVVKTEKRKAVLKGKKF